VGNILQLLPCLSFHPRTSDIVGDSCRRQFMFVSAQDFIIAGSTNKRSNPLSSDQQYPDRVGGGLKRLLGRKNLRLALSIKQWAKLPRRC
jgi:hypothetical protein